MGIDPKSFFGKGKSEDSDDDTEMWTASHQCQQKDCQLYSVGSQYNRKTGDMTWYCERGHKSQINIKLQ